MNEIIWQPTAEKIAATNMSAFLAEARADDPAIESFADLYVWSVRQPEKFWALLWSFCAVLAEGSGDVVVRHLDRMPGAQWFPDLRLNFAENLLRHRDEQPALVSWNETGRRSSITYDELYAQVRRLAAALARMGVGPGDRVAAFMPNLPETVVAMLAATSLGAIWSSCSPDFGAKGVLDRFGQIRPKVLFAADGYRFGGKTYDSLARVQEVLAQIPQIEQVVVLPYLAADPDLSFSPKAEAWADFAPEGSDPGGEIPFARLPFDHPLYIMYSSGTTGLPKCMVHGVGGTLIQHLKELVLHTDLKRQDRIFYFSTCGWMMWNWLVSSLAVGATVFLYDGSPMHPNSGHLFDLAEQEGVTVFGTSAKYLAVVEKEGVEPIHSHRLPALRTLLSTGSPLSPEGFDYVYGKIKQDLCLSSISGGTDILSCFALGNPIGPVRRGELQTRGLGMKVEVWNDIGQPVVGEKGELVCTLAFPSMPVSFWNDSESERYRAAYFEHYPGVWRHGDWAELRPEGGMVIHGRSDATLNPGGVRIGTAEIYRQVEQQEEVVESLVIGQTWRDDTRVVLFVRLREGVVLGSELEAAIRLRVRQNASPYHVPKRIVQVADIPRTLSGKITELAVRDVVHGRPVGNADAMANPEALEHFRNRPELAS
jgi:acetoacetyl-CoA synthetase